MKDKVVVSMDKIQGVEAHEGKANTCMYVATLIIAT